MTVRAEISMSPVPLQIKHYNYMGLIIILIKWNRKIKTMEQ